MMCYILEDEEDGYFGQEQVPLTDEIREILEEYPDGQIFKVCRYIHRSYLAFDICKVFTEYKIRTRDDVVLICTIVYPLIKSYLSLLLQ